MIRMTPTVVCQAADGLERDVSAKSACSHAARKHKRRKADRSTFPLGISLDVEVRPCGVDTVLGTPGYPAPVVEMW
jgi:hypothetical protein